MATPAPQKTSNLLKTLLLVLLIAGLSIGGTFFLLKQFVPAIFATAQLEPAVPTPVEVPKPIFLPLEPFTVTLNDPRASRILYTEISLRVLDEDSRQQLQTYMPEVRSRVLAELAKYDSPTLQTTEGRSQLITTLVSVLKAPYDSKIIAPSISSVLFTAFVVQ